MQRITITVEPDHYAAMACIAKESDVTVSWIIRRLMRDFLEHREREGSSRLDLGRPDKTVAADA
ncbi:MAG: ribbon-helix-helix protein, CopG family [Thiotrichales bacterium]|nr:ribbon-helix-helix protein, CopG family [Thiotrichales bacterium]MCY4349750.1 ribbon-helix-helix protein, CopG family [Thiotrichales bacterium]